MTPAGKSLDLLFSVLTTWEKLRFTITGRIKVIGNFTHRRYYITECGTIMRSKANRQCYSVDSRWFAQYNMLPQYDKVLASYLNLKYNEGMFWRDDITYNNSPHLRYRDLL